MKQSSTDSHIEQGLLRPAAAAQFLGVSVRTLQDWRFTGTGPRFIRYSARAVRYRVRDLEAWIKKREVDRLT